MPSPVSLLSSLVLFMVMSHVDGTGPLGARVASKFEPYVARAGKRAGDAAANAVRGARNWAKPKKPMDEQVKAEILRKPDDQVEVAYQTTKKGIEENSEYKVLKAPIQLW